MNAHRMLACLHTLVASSSLPRRVTSASLARLAVSLATALDRACGCVARLHCSNGQLRKVLRKPAGPQPAPKTCQTN